MTPPLLPISELATTQFLAANLWIGSDAICCWILNRQWHSLPVDLLIGSGIVFADDFWIGSNVVMLPISESAAAKLLVIDWWIGSGATFADDFWIDSDVVWLPISELAAKKLLAADFWIMQRISICCRSCVVCSESAFATEVVLIRCWNQEACSESSIRCQKHVNYS